MAIKMPNLFFIFCFLGIVSTSNAQQSNIILFTADDMGIQMGALNTPGVKTPAIDQLIKEGVFLTKAYAAFPSCSPSRTSILTGTYPHEHGVTTNVNEVLPELSATGTAKQSALNIQFAVKSEIVTLPEVLKNKGYYTGLTGKFHVSSPEKFPFDYWSKETKADEFFKQAKINNKPFFLDINVHSPHRPYVKSPYDRNII
ncbi:sulfatase-like hydrolase/transferase, partial [Pelobium sp.]